MKATNYHDSGDSSSKPSNTSTKNTSRSSKQHLKTLPNKKKQFPTYLHLTNPKIFLLKRKSLFSIKKNGENPCFVGGKRLIFSPLHFYRVFRCSKVLQLLRSSALHGQSPRPPAYHRCLGGTVPWHLEGTHGRVEDEIIRGRITPMRISP